MGMFDSYDNLASDYVADNTSPKESYDYTTLEKRPPRVAYNIKGNPVGLRWRYGDDFELNFTIVQKIKVAENSIIYTVKEASPDVTTEGVRGQQAYNTVDCKSWTCLGVSSGLYIWVEDDEVIYPTNGTYEIELSPDMTDTTFVVDIYNFRWEPVYSISSLGATDISVYINKDLSETFKPGIYYSVLKLQGIDDAVIKDKIMLIVE